MSSWQQQDAQEYFSKVMDEVDKEVRLAIRSYNKKEALFDSNPSEDKLESCGKNSNPIPQVHEEDTLVQNRALIRNPLEGLIAQRVGCTRCGHSEGLSLIPFNCLTVPLGQNLLYDIRECLDEYTALEAIEGVECAKCTLLSSQARLQSMMEPNYDAQLSSQSSKLQALVRSRLDEIDKALEEDDFSDNTLTKKCKIAPASKISTTKSRQAVIARSPEFLTIHVNRSLFDEHTGILAKNYGMVKFQKTLDLGPWCLGSKFGPEVAEADDDVLEEWVMDPAQSLLSNKSNARGPQYEIRAVVIHQGRHENGHYVCYRKQALPSLSSCNDSKGQAGQPLEKWWRFSDDVVDPASPEEVFGQGGVFMLFYERISVEDLIKDSTLGSTILPVKLDAIRDEGPSTNIPPTSQAELSPKSEQSEGSSSDDREQPESPPSSVQQILPASQTGFRSNVESAESREHVVSSSSSMMVTAN